MNTISSSSSSITASSRPLPAPVPESGSVRSPGGSGDPAHAAASSDAVTAITAVLIAALLIDVFLPMVHSPS